jgi:hypothetical protein
MDKIRPILFVVLILCGTSWALDEFDGIKCAADIPKALTRIMHEGQPGSGEMGRKVGRDPTGGLGVAKVCGVPTSWRPIAGSQRQLCHSPSAGGGYCC